MAPEASSTTLPHPRIRRLSTPNSPAAELDRDRRNHDDDDDDEDDDIEMHAWETRAPALTRGDTGRSAAPLLQDEERGRGGMGSYDRRRQLRSRSPGAAAAAKMQNRRKYLLAGVFLGLSLVSFVVQTETAVYIQKELGWHKAYAMLYLTHGSWVTLWPIMVLFLKTRKPHTPWRVFLRSHVHHLLTTCRMIQHNTLHPTPLQNRTSPLRFITRQILLITCALTFAGSTWYIAVNMTTPSDLTAIYNCSTFFAYVFSVIMLKEPLRADKIGSVAVAIVGVLIVAYGDGADEESVQGARRLTGNIVIGVGSVLYGFYEVLYKKMACPPAGVSAGRSVIFAVTVCSALGFVTLTLMWIPIPLLHMLGLETFELPTGEAAWVLAISVAANAVFSGSFLTLMSLTSPVLASVSALLTIFLVAVVDWAITGQPLTTSAVLGGLIICAAFFLLAWSTWREMNEEQQTHKKLDDGESDILSTDSD